MKIAHFSDTHLGYRAYGRQHDSGLNQREHDVMQTFDRFLASILEREPDLVIHTGDLFHTVRPGNHTIVHTFDRLTRFQRQRCNRPFVLIAGNHDSPKTSESGSILRLLGNPQGTGNIQNFHVLTDGVKSILLEGVEVVGVPSNGLLELKRIRLLPTGKRPVSILAVHGLIPSVERTPNFELEQSTTVEDWSYIALGDYHIRKLIKPNAAYSGSTDFTTSNIWQEATDPKGWYLFDSQTQDLRFVEVKPVRRVIDLPPVDATQLSSQEIADKLCQAITWDPSEQPIVRQVIWNLRPHVMAEIPQEAINEVKRHCLWYYLDRRIETAKQDVSDTTYTAAFRRTLLQEWTEYAGTRTIPTDIQRSEFIETGVAVLKEAASDTQEADAY